jgi:undecaprenyl-diphosphatase
MEAFDNGLHYALRTHRAAEFDRIMIAMTSLGSIPVLALVTILAVGLLYRLDRRRTAFLILAAIVSGALLVEQVRQILNRERPDFRDPPLPLEPFTGSFPSAHAFNASCVYLTLALLAGRFLSSRAARFLVAWSVAVLFLVGLSRITLGLNYFSDVLTGWVGGVAWALAWHHWALTRLAEPIQKSSTSGSE